MIPIRVGGVGFDRARFAFADRVGEPSGVERAARFRARVLWREPGRRSVALGASAARRRLARRRRRRRRGRRRARLVRARLPGAPFAVASVAGARRADRAAPTPSPPRRSVGPARDRLVRRLGRAQMAPHADAPEKQRASERGPHHTREPSAPRRVVLFELGVMAQRLVVHCPPKVRPLLSIGLGLEKRAVDPRVVVVADVDGRGRALRTCADFSPSPAKTSPEANGFIGHFA